MGQIQTKNISMKPRIYFVIGTVLLVGVTSALLVLTIYSIGLLSFLVRQHGPMGQIRLTELLASFPWWAGAAGLIGLGGILVLAKRVRFSYKYNFWMVALIMLVGMLVCGLLLDRSGLAQTWFRRGPGWRRVKQSQINLPGQPPCHTVNCPKKN